MEVTRTLAVSVEEMDACIKKMVLEDIKNATGKKVKCSDIGAGYKYRKELKNKMGKVGKVTTRIDALESGNYRASFESAQGINHLSYSYQPLHENQISLLYLEDYEAISTSKKLNYSLMSFLYKRSNKKRINLMLNQLENFILENRKQPAA